MKRNQTLHEKLIPMLVEGIGAESYLELGTYHNETIRRVNCRHRYGVDKKPVLTDGIVFFEMTTTEFIKELAKEYSPFDCVFIDASHTALDVMKDFLGIWPHVADEGLVFLHDANPETVEDTDPGLCGDAWGAVRDLTALYECVTIPYHPGLTIIRKRSKGGPV